MTKRQMDILRHITQGRSNKQIARDLDLSENTVKVHVSAMLRALGLANRTQAGILGQKLGLDESAERQQLSNKNQIGVYMSYLFRNSQVLLLLSRWPAECLFA